jgi:hypothetical protein
MATSTTALAYNESGTFAIFRKNRDGQGKSARGRTKLEKQKLTVSTG